MPETGNNQHAQEGCQNRRRSLRLLHETKIPHKEGIAAKVENGILTVTLPKVKKVEKKAAKAIEIS